MTDYCNWPGRHTGRISLVPVDNGLGVSFVLSRIGEIREINHKNDALSSNPDVNSRRMSRMDHGYRASLRRPIFERGYDFALHSLTELLAVGGWEPRSGRGTALPGNLLWRRTKPAMATVQLGRSPESRESRCLGSGLESEALSARADASYLACERCRFR